MLFTSALEDVMLELSDVGFPPLPLTLVAVDWADAADADSASAAIDAKNTRFIDRTPITILHQYMAQREGTKALHLWSPRTPEC